MTLEIYFTARFKRDYKQMLKRGANKQRLADTVELLRTRQPLPPERRDHALSGDYEGFRECHIQPDWLLVYRVEEERLMLTLLRTGTHSDLF